jgi:hypothetical protein
MFQTSTRAMTNTTTLPPSGVQSGRKPELRTMLNMMPAVPAFGTAILGAPMPENDQRGDYVRARPALPAAV